MTYDRDSSPGNEGEAHAPMRTEPPPRSSEENTLVLRSDVGIVLFTFVSWILLGLGAGGLLYYGSQKYVFKFSFYKYDEIVFFVAVTVAGLIVLKAIEWFLRIATTVFTFSERHIREERLLPWPKSESCDMTDVRDIKKYFMGFWGIKIISKDLTTPIIRISFISCDSAEKGLRFLQHYANKNYVEYDQRKRLEQRKSAEKNIF